MGNSGNSGNSGEGSRPTTAGGVDNIGGADSFTPGQASESGDTSPGPREKITEKRVDKAAAKQDDSAPLGLHGSAEDVSNVESQRAGST